jgi:hypothetical protein
MAYYKGRLAIGLSRRGSRAASGGETGLEGSPIMACLYMCKLLVRLVFHPN